MPTIQKPVPNLKITAHFTPRHAMRARGAFGLFSRPAAKVPPTTLPVDSTGNASVLCPIDHNDDYGICGPAMCLHVYNILTYRQGQGKEKGLGATTLANLLTQYLKISGGDNGTDEAMLVGAGGIWRTGIANDPADVIVDALDIDVADIPLTQYAIDQFYTVQMAWSVPDAFINTFDTGLVYAKAGIPDPMNGHYTPLASVRSGSYTPPKGPAVDVTGFYELWTWGGWCLVSPAFVASVQPQCFIVFSARQFDPSTGLDSKNRHIVTQAAKWLACGGNMIPAAVINAFPPPNGPVPTPTPPGPTPVPTPTPPSTIQQQIDQLFAGLEAKLSHVPKILAAVKLLQAKIDALFLTRKLGAEKKMSVSVSTLINDAVALAAALEPQYATEINVLGQVLNLLLPLIPVG